MHEWEMIEFRHINSTFSLGNMSLVTKTMALWSLMETLCEANWSDRVASTNALNSLFLVFAPMIQKIRQRNSVFTGKSWLWLAPWGGRCSTRSQEEKTLTCTGSSDCYLRRSGSYINTPFLSLLSCVSGVYWSWGEGRHCVMFSGKRLRI